MQMEKKVEKEGDCAQTGCCTMAFCIDASSSSWSRILLNFFLSCRFSFLGEREARVALVETHLGAQSTAIFLETVW